MFGMLPTSMNQTFQMEGDRKGKCLDYNPGHGGGKQENKLILNDKMLE